MSVPTGDCWPQRCLGRAGGAKLPVVAAAPWAGVSQPSTRHSGALDPGVGRRLVDSFTAWAGTLAMVTRKLHPRETSKFEILR